MSKRERARHVDRQGRLSNAALVADKRRDASLWCSTGHVRHTRQQTIENRPQLRSGDRTTEKIAHVGAQQLYERRPFGATLLEAIRKKRRGDRRVRKQIL